MHPLLPSSPTLEKCRWCDEKQERLPIYVVLPDREDPRRSVTFKFDKLRCVVQWAVLQGWPK
jgi:hypothetical protein